MGYGAVIHLEKQMVKIQQEMNSYSDCRTESLDMIIYQLMKRAKLAGLCIAMREACRHAEHELSHPDEWHQEKIDKYVKLHSKGSQQ